MRGMSAEEVDKTCFLPQPPEKRERKKNASNKQRIAAHGRHLRMKGCSEVVKQVESSIEVTSGSCANPQPTQDPHLLRNQ